MTYHDNRLKFILTLICILLSKSLYYDSFGQNFLLFACAPAFFVMFYVKNIKIYEDKFWYILLYVVLIFASINFVTTTAVVFILRIFIALVITEFIDFRLFATYYIRIMLFIGVCSLLYFPIIYFNISSFLPAFKALDGRFLQNFLVFGVSNSFLLYSKFRNSGLWWEPGAFALMINVAYVFIVGLKKTSLKLNILFFIIILSTQSTTGIFAILLIFLAGVEIKELSFKHVQYFLIFGGTLVFFMIVFILPDILSKFDPTDNKFISFLSRFFDVQLSFELFLKHWLLGYGYGAIDNVLTPSGYSLFGMGIYDSPLKPTGADGVTMLISQLGIFSIFLLYPFLFPKYLEHLSLWRRVLVFFALLIMFNTENFSYTLLMPLLSFYGLRRYG